MTVPFEMMDQGLAECAAVESIPELAESPGDAECLRGCWRLIHRKEWTDFVKIHEKRKSTPAPFELVEKCRSFNSG